MNKDNAKDFLPIIQAWSEGRQIQFRTVDVWVDVGDRTQLIFFNNPEDYRVKPEPPKPREWWINRYTHLDDCIHASKADADRNATSCRIECVHVREILDESQS